MKKFLVIIILIAAVIIGGNLIKSVGKRINNEAKTLSVTMLEMTNEEI